MVDEQDYILGQSKEAARRLEIQDKHFHAPSEYLLDELKLQPADRVVELGCGPGGFSQRILARLGEGGVVVGVDSAEGLLEQAMHRLDAATPGKFEAIRSDITQLGPWLRNASVVTARAVLHHVPMAEFLVGRLLAKLPSGTRVGFMEPDFRTPLARLAYLVAQGKQELAPLLTWAKAINDLYALRRISPDVGATLAATMEGAGYAEVRAKWWEFPCDELVIENILMFYDEVREPLDSLGILSTADIDEQQRLLRALPKRTLTAVWGVHVVTGIA